MSGRADGSAQAQTLWQMTLYKSNLEKLGRN